MIPTSLIEYPATVFGAKSCQVVRLTQLSRRFINTNISQDG